MNGIIKRYSKLAILFTVTAAALIIVHFILKAVSYPYSSVSLLFVGGIVAVAAVICWILFGLEMKKIKDRQRVERQWEEEFAEWLKHFEPLTKIGAELVRTESDGEKFSKFGGLPVVTSDFKWPTDNGKPIPFLLQLDFSEINPTGNLINFPTSGLMYVFVYEFVNEEYEIEHIKKVLFFDNAEVLFRADKPKNLPTTFNEIYVAPKFIKTYPDVFDCDEAFEMYCARPQGGMDDDYDALCNGKTECHLVGGWPSHLQNGGFMKECREDEGDNWVLLLQIKSEYVKDGEDNFMWGDNGVIYIYIREKDLIARNFDNIKLEMQCY